YRAARHDGLPRHHQPLRARRSDPRDGLHLLLLVKREPRRLRRCTYRRAQARSADARAGDQGGRARAYDGHVDGTYLGRGAAQRVLSGRIMRGVADRIDAVIWFSDLQGFTRITDSAPEQIIPLLNDYADVIVSVIHAKGGDVLKLIGDGILAIFTAADRAHACAAALAAAMTARSKVAALNERRGRDGLPVTDMYLGLHAGEVFYGNIGSTERLDFTVLGPAVNETSRIAAMCRSVEQPVLVSEAFAKVGCIR